MPSAAGPTAATEITQTAITTARIKSMWLSMWLSPNSSKTYDLHRCSTCGAH